MISEAVIIISLVFILVFSISIHEMGHLIAMQVNSIGIKEVSIGIGPKLFSIKRNDIIYSFRLGFLLGAYVMPDNNFDIVKSKYHTIYQKLCIFSIGIIINLITSILFFILYKYILFISDSETVFSVYLNIISDFNFRLAIINIIPVFFLTDGSKILKTILNYNFNEKLGNILNIIFNIFGTILFIYVVKCIW